MEQLAKLLREPKPLPPFPFLKLPLELRLQIWKLSLPLGRAIKVEIDVDRAKAYNRSRLPLSALLHVCQESRRFALTVFRRGFQNTPESRNNFYWSPKLDTIWLYNDLQILTWDFPLEKLQNAPSTSPDLDDLGYILPGVRHLAMQLSAYRHYRVWDWDGSNGTWMPLFLRRFRNLKTVSFLTEDGECNQDLYRTQTLIDSRFCQRELRQGVSMALFIFIRPQLPQLSRIACANI
jgi:hypothetical protein